jgi:hypothetical protein
MDTCFSDFYARARKHYYAHEYTQAADCFRQALRVAVSDFAQGECRWWLALCRAKEVSR